jgi:hypothetical protein
VRDDVEVEMMILMDTSLGSSDEVCVWLTGDFAFDLLTTYIVSSLLVYSLGGVL